MQVPSKHLRIALKEDCMDRIVVWGLAILAAVGLAVLLMQPPANKVSISQGSEVLVIQGATLIDGTGSPPLENATIVIRGNRFQAVGPATSVEVPANAQKLDLSGLTILPGLVDSHMHLGMAFMTASPGNPPQSEEIQSLLKAFIEQGVTSVKDVGDVYPFIVGIKRSIAEGQVIGPRLFVAGPFFTAPAGHPAGTFFKGNDFLIQNGTRQVTDPKVAREEVRKLAQGGVDFIKAVYDAGSPTDRRGIFPKLDLQILKAIIEEAHQLKLKVIVHCEYARDLKELVELTPAPDAIEHVGITAIPEDVISKIKAHGTYVDPTTVGYEAQMPPGVYENSTQRKNLQKFISAGVTLTAGTDAPYIMSGLGLQFGESLHRELELLVDGGLTPMQAIQAATKNAAELLGKADELGTIKAGQLADLIAISGNPLENITNSRNVQVVIKDGKVLIDKRKQVAQPPSVTTPTPAKPAATAQLPKTSEAKPSTSELKIQPATTLEQAADFLNQARKLFNNPTTAEELLKSQALLQAAETGLHSLVERNAKEAMTVYWLGRVQYALAEQFETEVKAWGIELDKRKASQYFAAAAESAKHAVELKDTFSDAHRLIGQSIMRLIAHRGTQYAISESPKAKQEIERAIQLDAANALAQVALGIWYLRMPDFFGGDANKATDAFTKAITLARDEHERFSAYTWLAQALMKRHEIGKAREQLQQALAIYPNSILVRELLQQLPK